MRQGLIGFVLGWVVAIVTLRVVIGDSLEELRAERTRLSVDNYELQAKVRLLQAR